MTDGMFEHQEDGTNVEDYLIPDGPAPPADVVMPPPPPMDELLASPLAPSPVASPVMTSPHDTQETAPTGEEESDEFRKSGRFAALDVGRRTNTELLGALCEEEDFAEEQEEGEEEVEGGEQLAAEVTTAAEGETDTALQPEEQPVQQQQQQQQQQEEEHEEEPNLAVFGHSVDATICAAFDAWLQQRTAEEKARLMNKAHTSTTKPINSRLTRSTAASSAWAKSSELGAGARKLERRQSTGLTIPKPFTLSTSARASWGGKAEVLTSEERELRAAQHAREKHHKQLLQNAMMQTRNKHAPRATVSKSTKTLTIPESPQLRLKVMHGNKPAPATQDPTVKEQQLQAEAEASAARAKFNPHKVTTPRPFRLSTSYRAKPHAQHLHQGGCSSLEQQENTQAQANANGMTVGEMLYKMDSMPPQRFLSVPKGSKPMPEQTNYTGKITVPKTPPLHEAKKAGKPQPLTTEEMEFQEVQNFQFKARPFNRAIVSSNGTYGIPKVEVKGVTQSAPFKFHESSHRPTQVNDEDEVELQKQFKARPMPSQQQQSAAHRRHTMGTTSTMKLTVPKSPQFATSQRLRGPSSTVSENEPQNGQHRNAGRKAQHKVKYTGGLTEPKPFNFATEFRSATHEAKARHEEEEVYKFKARQMPDFTNVYEPQPSQKELTEFDEFNLKSVQLHHQSQQHFENKREHELEEQRRMSQVRARKAPESTFEPTFQITHSEREPLTTMDVNLHSTVRAQQRQDFNVKNQEYHAEIARMKKQRAAARLEEEKRKLRELRTTSMEEGGLMFRAKPVRANAAPFKPAPSHQELTVPVTPQLATQIRSAVHRQKA